MIIDTHVHYNLDPLAAAWQKHWISAQTAGVKKSIVIGTDPLTNVRAIEIAQQEPQLFCALGIHPHESGEIQHQEALMSQLKSLIANTQSATKKLVAIGECGLDYFRLPENGVKRSQEIASQQHLFDQHLKLAQEFKLPVIIHCRDKGNDAYNDALQILKVYSGLRFVLHCMSGSTTYLRKALALGGYISFAGNVTYKNVTALRELVMCTPTDRLLVETDAPFLPPQTKRGQVNEPKYIVETVQTLAEIFHITRNTCEKITTENAERMFCI